MRRWYLVWEFVYQEQVLMMLVFELNISSSLMTLESAPGDCVGHQTLLQTVTDPSSYQRCCYPAETSNNHDFVIIYHQAWTGHNLRNSKKIVLYIIQSKLKGQSCHHYYYYSILYHLTWSVSTCMSDSLHSLWLFISRHSDTFLCKCIQICENNN